MRILSLRVRVHSVTLSTLHAKFQIILALGLLLHGFQGTLRTLVAVIISLGVAVEVWYPLEQWEQQQRKSPNEGIGQ